MDWYKGIEIDFLVFVIFKKKKDFLVFVWIIKEIKLFMVWYFKYRIYMF